jgi:hypothetical protein
VCSYRSFDSEQPEELVKRYFEHGPEKTQREQLIQEREKELERVDMRNEQLKKQLLEIEGELMQNSETLNHSMLNLRSESRKQ